MGKEIGTIAMSVVHGIHYQVTTGTIWSRAMCITIFWGPMYLKRLFAMK